MAETGMAGARLLGPQPEIKARDLRDLPADVLTKENIDKLPIFSHEDVMAHNGKEPFVFKPFEKSTYYVFVLDGRFPEEDVDAIKRILDRDDSHTTLGNTPLPILEEKPDENEPDQDVHPILTLSAANNEPYMLFFSYEGQDLPQDETLKDGTTYIVAKKEVNNESGEITYKPQAAVRMTRRGRKDEDFDGMYQKQTNMASLTEWIGLEKQQTKAPVRIPLQIK